jgi:hypothetical protein
MLQQGVKAWNAWRDQHRDITAQGWETHGVYQQAFDRLLRDLKAAERQPGG